MSKKSKINISTLSLFTISDFDIGVELGRGQFGRVYLTKEKKSDLLVALKVIGKCKTIDYEKQLYYEIHFHSKLIHPNIIRMYTHFHDLDYLYYVLEFACNGSLFNNLRQQKYKRFNENLAAKYVYQTADALKYCHEQGFFHGDVKPENILIDVNGDAKLSDFGLAWPLDNSTHSRNGVCGTREYIAPEQLKGKPYNEKIDHWCLGIMCYELLVGRSPFYSKKIDVLRQRILCVDVRFPKIVTTRAKELICQLLQFQPDVRFSLDRVMSHNWIVSNCKQSQIF